MGQRPKILGFTTFGMAVPMLRGAEGPDQGDQNTQGHQQYQQPPQYQSQPDPTQQQQPPAEQQPPVDQTVSRQEYDDLMRRMQAADRNKSQTEAKLKEYEDAAKSELEKAQAAAEEALARAEKAEKELRESHVEREFLKLPGFDWHDAGDALRLLDREGVEVREDGTVKGVEEAAKKLAKAKPFMLKVASGGEGEGKRDKGQQNTGDPDQQQAGGSSAATGTNPAGPNDRNNRSSDRDRLTKKFPALGRR